MANVLCNNTTADPARRQDQVIKNISREEGKKQGLFSVCRTRLTVIPLKQNARKIIYKFQNV
jgi:hypothetical protein